jgi:uncharacterized repeat protein (TIGR01451 family)
METRWSKNLIVIIGITLILFLMFMIVSSKPAGAGSYNGQDLALAILANQSTLVSSSYTDTDTAGHRQGIVLSSLGTMVPKNGSTFALLSTGIAGANPVTTNGENPGDERGTWFKSKYGQPRDSATLTMVLEVPSYMHYLYYDVQFFSTEYPEYVGSQYNDKFTITVNSPSKGTTTYVIDVNSGNFVLDSNYIPGTGFGIFATSGNPINVDIVDTTPRTPGADAGATASYRYGGEFHPVSPNEQITVKFNIKDVGDNQFDSAAFIDNLVFSGYAKTDIIARKTVQDLNGGVLECNDTLQYTITISNTGAANQGNNPGNEFEDFIPANTTYVTNSATATSGTIGYSGGKIIWNGGIPAKSSVALTFKVRVNQSVHNGTIISNQGTVYWDSDEDPQHTNDATELTDDSSIDDGIDKDGDGQTDDDDPTNIVAIVFEPPLMVTEDFSDDTTGGNATQAYRGRVWFNTSRGALGSVFEVVSGYHYSTPKSFKTKIRSTSGTMYWYYNLSALERDIKSWEIWFACGNNTGAADLCLDFKNDDENTIAKIKFEYVHQGSDPLMDWVLELYYQNPTSGWVRLNSDHTNGYLFNGWYKLRIEKNGLNYMNYSLYRTGKGLVNLKTDGQLNSPFSNLEKIEWSSTKNPIVCPMFFWDEHKLELI